MGIQLATQEKITNLSEGNEYWYQVSTPSLQDNWLIVLGYGDAKYEDGRLF
jgi:hypothetical protein